MAIAQKTFNDYLDDAKEMAYEVSKVTDRIERERMIPPEITTQMKDRGLFRLLMPRSLDGAELDHPSFLRLVFEFGRADASVGWCFNQNNVFATRDLDRLAQCRHQWPSDARHPRNARRWRLSAYRPVELQQWQSSRHLARCVDSHQRLYPKRDSGPANPEEQSNHDRHLGRARPSRHRQSRFRGQ